MKLKFKGIKKTYANGALPVKSKVKCKAKDPTSGIKSCKIKGFKTTKGTHKLKATAINGAGLKTKATFTYTIPDYPAVPPRGGPGSATLRPC